MTMIPFGYPDSTHIRTLSPGHFRSYRRYKPFLRVEFMRRCVYCRMPDGPKGEDSFGVDHYRPVSRFRELRSEYTNLFYSCNPCNRRKGNFWPTETQWQEGVFLPNPCDYAMSQHLQFRGCRVEPLSRAGELAVEMLMLNAEEILHYREFVVRSIKRCLERAGVISQTIIAVNAKLGEVEGPRGEELRLVLNSLQADLAMVAADYERLAGVSLPGSEE
jgi:HNH endonuclease